MKCRKIIKGRIVWLDDDNKDSTRPSTIEIVLNRNGENYESVILPTANNDTYVFDCLPIKDNSGNFYSYSIDEVSPNGYTKTTKGFDIINTLQMVKIGYVFNNIVHNDYHGKVYTKVSRTYPITKTIVIIDKNEAYPDYTGDCEFVGWNTLENGSGTYYYPGDELTISQDLTLYAIWRSCQPTISEVHEGNTIIRGNGVVGKGNIYSLILVAFPNGNFVATSTVANGTWSLSVPASSRPLLSGATIGATQTERGKLVSASAYTIVIA